jgi:hypothetical protein
MVICGIDILERDRLAEFYRDAGFTHGVIRKIFLNVDYIIVVLSKECSDRARIGSFVSGNAVVVQDGRKTGDVEGEHIEITTCGCCCD